MKFKFRTKVETIEGIEVANDFNENLKFKGNHESSTLVDALLLHDNSKCLEKGINTNLVSKGITWKSLEALTYDKGPISIISEVHLDKLKGNWKNEKVKQRTGQAKSNVMKYKNTKHNQDEDQKDSNKDDADSGMNYVQILLYYVQDATLFKIHLPNVQQQSDNFLVKLLQFSPEILTVYYKVSDMCFTRNTTAMMKVFLSSMFGSCIVLFLCIVYLIQWMMSICLKRHSHIWETVRSKLTQEFLLTVLFSY